MSSILKALRKLEEEKAAMGQGGVDLSRNILKRSAPRQKSNTPLLIMIIGVLLIAVIVTIWVVMAPNRTKTNVATVLPEVTMEIKAISETPAAALKSAPVEKVQPVKAEQPASSVVVIEKVIPDVMQPEPAIEIVVLEPEKISVPEPPEKTESLSFPVESSVPQIQPAVTESPPVDESFPDGAPVLLITTIAFKPAPGERLAVVNDLPVMEGTSIDGVQIVEILEDGVRFAWQGVEFVLPLTEENTQN